AGRAEALPVRAVSAGAETVGRPAGAGDKRDRQAEAGEHRMNVSVAADRDDPAVPAVGDEEGAVGADGEPEWLRESRLDDDRAPERASSESQHPVARRLGDVDGPVPRDCDSNRIVQASQDDLLLTAGEADDLCCGARVEAARPIDEVVDRAETVGEDTPPAGARIDPDDASRAAVGD